jgi:TetR/AcrR family transcriptional repressor of nem operon
MILIMSSTPSRKEISHERIVDVASRAIRRAGTRGVGVADMMKEAGLTHGGFYAHFESRDALVAEAMQRAGRDTSAALEAAVTRRAASGDSRFAALVRAYLHDSHLERIEDGCVVAALASEMVRLDNPVRDEARRRITALVDLVRSTLPPGGSSAQAEYVAATLVGALQLARVLGDKPGRDLLARTRKQLIAHFDSASIR